MTAEYPEPAPRDRVRVSDAEREAVLEQLRDAAAEGRLELDELDSRIEQALTARTYGDLVAVTVDLPPGSHDPRKPLVLKGGMHGITRSGPWRVPQEVALYGGMGGVKIDFTQADCRLPEVAVEAHGQMAGVTIVVPDGWTTDTEVFDTGIGGLKDRTTPDRLPGTALIRLTGTGGMAGVVIRHPTGRERRKHKRDQSS